MGNVFFMTMKPFKEIHLPNGLRVCFTRQDHRYFGDYHRVRLEITCSVPLDAEYFASQDEWERASRTLGETVLFRRNIEHMGVPTAEVESTLENAAENFCRHSLHYLASQEFPRKLIRSELAKVVSVHHSRRYQG